MLILHPSNAETVTGNSGAVSARDSEYVSLFVNVTAITGSSPTLVVKIQDSADGTNFADVASFNTASLNATGVVKVIVPTTGTKCADYVRAVWTIGGSSPSVTFTAHLSTLVHRS